MWDVVLMGEGCASTVRRQQRNIESTLGLSSAKRTDILISFWNVLNACRVPAFVCAKQLQSRHKGLGYGLGSGMYLRAFASARERVHRHHQFKSTTEYQSANKYQARVAIERLSKAEMRGSSSRFLRDGRRHPVVTIYTMPIVKFCIRTHSRTFILLIWFFFSLFLLPLSVGQPSSAPFCARYSISSRNGLCFFCVVVSSLSLTQRCFALRSHEFRIVRAYRLGCPLSTTIVASIVCAISFSFFFPYSLFYFSFLSFSSSAVVSALFRLRLHVWIWIDRNWNANEQSHLFLYNVQYVADVKRSECLPFRFVRCWWMAMAMVVVDARCCLRPRFDLIYVWISCNEKKRERETTLLALCVQKYFIWRIMVSKRKSKKDFIFFSW